MPLAFGTPLDLGGMTFKGVHAVSGFSIIHWSIILGLGVVAWAGPRLGPAQPIDLNAATATALIELPRVGVRMAARIVAFRQQHGPFQRLEEIMNVKGIGEKAFQRLSPHLTLSAGGEGGPRSLPARGEPRER
jgi:competence ComEA-like helix-hairpin-helix protein